MISLISFILVLIGAFNWFSIGILQFDFVAGIFGSQANIFSRLVYAIIGFAAIWLIYATIKQKGRIFVSGNRSADTKLIEKVKHVISKDDKNDTPPTTNHESEYKAQEHNEQVEQPSDTPRKEMDKDEI